MAIKDAGFLSRTIFFAVLAALLYVAGFMAGAAIVIAGGCIAELFFWASLFKGRSNEE